MAGHLNSVALNSRRARQSLHRARKRLRKGDRQPHWHRLGDGVHLGWQCDRGEAVGRWIVRRYVGKRPSAAGLPTARYITMTIGKADDVDKADDKLVLSFDQAVARARTMIATPDHAPAHKITVRQAFDAYVEHLRNEGRPDRAIADVVGRARAHILPVLGDLVVAELKTDQLRRWLADLAKSAAQNRPTGDGDPQYRAMPATEEAVRARAASANRVLTMLKAALNYVYDENLVPDRAAWGRRLRPFANATAARIRYLSIAESQRLLNAADPAFRPLLRAALETGARYGELRALEVADFDTDVGTIAIRKSKTGKPRHVVLTEAGASFFRQHCAGRPGHALMFARSNGQPWHKSDQKRPMRAACARARIDPPIGIHQLRHTWASLAVMNGVPLLIVAKNLGHTDGRMVEKHYSHLAPSYITDAIRTGAPIFVGDDDTTVVPLHKSNRPLT